MSIAKTYFCLLLLLLLTFVVSHFSLGLLNDILSWFFALLKALLILFNFMHFRRELESSKVYFTVGVAALVLLVIGVLDDVLLR